VASYFLLHPESGGAICREYGRPGFYVDFSFLCNCAMRPRPRRSRVRPRKEVSLSPDYYKRRRSCANQGFDISFRFGPYGAATHHYARFA